MYNTYLFIVLFIIIICMHVDMLITKHNSFVQIGDSIADLSMSVNETSNQALPSDSVDDQQNEDDNNRRTHTWLPQWISNIIRNRRSQNNSDESEDSDA